MHIDPHITSFLIRSLQSACSVDCVVRTYPGRRWKGCRLGSSSAKLHQARILGAGPSPPAQAVLVSYGSCHSSYPDSSGWSPVQSEFAKERLRPLDHANKLFYKLIEIITKVVEKKKKKQHLHTISQGAQITTSCPTR